MQALSIRSQRSIIIIPCPLHCVMAPIVVPSLGPCMQREVAAWLPGWLQVLSPLHVCFSGMLPGRMAS